MTDPNWPTAAQLAHNDQIIARIGSKLDGLIEVHRLAPIDGNLHPQVALAGLSDYLAIHSSTGELAQLLAVAIDRLTRCEVPS